jgi:hypothetical protein
MAHLAQDCHNSLSKMPADTSLKQFLFSCNTDEAMAHLCCDKIATIHFIQMPTKFGIIIFVHCTTSRKATF